MQTKSSVSAPFPLKRSSKQRGISLIALFLIMAVLGAIGLIAMRSLPGWSEYYSIKKGIQRLETEGITDASEIRKKWDERAPLEYITTLTGQELKIQKVTSGVKITFNYEKRVPLVGNTVLVYEFTNE